MGKSFAKSSSARLAAVQILYQWQHTGGQAQTCLEDYLANRVGMVLENEDGEELQMEKPDGVLLKKIVLGVEERHDDLQTMVKAAKSQQEGGEEHLLHSILLAGTYELMAHHDVDQPIIINDYLNVAHAFYSKGEVSMVNAILDTMRKEFS